MSAERNRTNSNPYASVPELPASGSIDLEQLVAGTGPLELEIGFGRARFLLARGEANPTTRLVGIETRRKWVYRATERVARRGLGNIAVYLADAREVVQRMAPKGCLARIFVNFPDPWWKARHQKRQVLGERFANRLAELLSDRGQLFVQTDVDVRAESHAALLSATPTLEPVEPGGRTATNPFGARSSREIRCEDLGLPVHRLLFARVPR